MLKLVIGNKNYSSWSLRAWLLLDAFDVEFEEIAVSLTHEGLSERLGKYSDAKRVPVLIEDDLTVWDSLAICEYVSEQYLAEGGWPDDSSARAKARSVCAEMHSGFQSLRNAMPMNIRALRSVEIDSNTEKDIKRVETIWTEMRRNYSSKGPYLFGDFSIADCFFAPVVMRFQTYGVKLAPEAQAYCEALTNHHSMKKWIESALKETEIVEEDEAGENR